MSSSVAARSPLPSARRNDIFQNVDSTSYLADLNKALGPLFDGIDRINEILTKFAITDFNSKSFWNRSSFAKYIGASLPGSQASFPFSAPTTAHNQVPESAEKEIDLEAFKRAFVLLVMRGFELFGAKQDGRPLSRATQKSYIDKVPRLTRIIVRCLSVPSPEPATQSGATQDVLQLQDVKDTIAFTQPITFDPYPYGPSVGDELFEAAAIRLLSMEDERSAVQGSSRTLTTANLQGLIQLLLLLRPRKQTLEK